MDWLGFALVCVAVALGAAGQRAIGMGFGLVAMPVLVMSLGPLPAVVAVNALGVVTASMVWMRTGKFIQWRRLWWLLIPAVIASVPGILIARAVPADALRIAVGVLILVGVVLAQRFTRSEREFSGPTATALAGTTVGVLNGAVGVGAPAIGVYGIVSKWEPKAFGATLQPFFVIMSTATVLVKLAIDPGDLPWWPWWLWLMLLVPLVGGTALGDVIAHRLSASATRWIIVIVSALGGLTVLITGILGLVAAAGAA